MNLKHAFLCIFGIWCLKLAPSNAAELPKSSQTKVGVRILNAIQYETDKEISPFVVLFNTGETNGIVAHNSGDRSSSHLHDVPYADSPWSPTSRSIPEVLAIFTNRTVTVGKGVGFRCKVVGTPKPRIKWKKNGVTVTQSYRIRIRYSDNTSRLRIKNVQPSDRGFYQCMAKNSEGHMLSSRVYLTVRGSRRILKNRCEQYTGTICTFNYHNSVIHVPHGYQQHQIEKRLRQSIKILDQTYVISQRCRKHLNRFLCRLNFLSCLGGARKQPARVCREDCVNLERKYCRRELKASNALRTQWRKMITCSRLPAAERQQAAYCIFGIPKKDPKVPNPHRKKPSKVHTSVQNVPGAHRDSNSSRKCVKYTGTLCKRFIPMSGLISIHGSKSQSQAEQSLHRTLARLKGYISTKCGRYLQKALCYQLFPPCSRPSGQLPKHICKAQCEVLKGRVCSKEFRYATLFQENSEILPNCETLPTSAKQNSEPCLSLGFRVNESDSQSEVNGLDHCSSFLKRRRNNQSIFATPDPRNNTSFMCGNKSQSFDSAKVKLPSEVLQLIRNVKDDIDKGQVSAHIEEDGSTTYCFQAQIPLGNLVQEWKHYHRSIRLPLLHRQSRTPGLKVTVKNSSIISVLVPHGSAASYKAHAKMTLDDVKFYYRYSAGRGSFVAIGKYYLCETVFDVQVERLKKGVIRISGNSSSPLDVDTIERVFGLAMPSPMLFKAITRSELLIMRLINPTIEAYVDKDIVVKFSGQSYMYIGWNAYPTYLQFYTGRQHRSDLLIAGLTSQDLTFNEALEVFTGMQLPYLGFIEDSTNSSIGVSMATDNIDSSHNPYIHFNKQPLSTTLAGAIPRGLTIVVKSGLPRVCNNSRLCQLLKVVFGDGSRFTTSITASQDRVSINLALDKVSDDALVVFDSAKVTLKVVGGSINRLDSVPFLTFDVQGNIHESGRQKNLQFRGQLAYEGIMSKLQGKFSSAQEWREAFGIKHLTLKNLRVRISVPTGSLSGPMANSVSSEASFEYGVGCLRQKDSSRKNSCITGQTYLGLSEDVSEHYFYGKVRALTLQQLLQACDVNIQLPAAVATIGFPKGLTISVAKGIHDLRTEGGPLVSPGLIMSGRINVFGIETDATVSLLPREFLIDSDVTGGGQERVDDVTPLQTSTIDRKYGPKLYLKTRIDPTPFLKVHIDGYARIFGVFDELRIVITRDVTQIKMVGEIYKSVRASLYLTSNSSRRSNKTHLQAKIIFQNGLSKLTRLASKHVVMMLEKEKSQLKVAEGEAQRQSKICLKTSRRECSACLSRPSCRDVLSSCLKERTPSSGRNGLQAICQRALFDGCQGSNGTCKQICTLIGSKLNGTCKAYHEAAKSLHELERSLKWVKQAQLFITGSFFRIHGISFEADASPSDLLNIFVDTTFDVTIFGQRHQLRGLTLRLDAFTQLASEIARHAVTWYGKRGLSRRNRYQGNRPRSSP